MASFKNKTRKEKVYFWVEAGGTLLFILVVFWAISGRSIPFIG